ncbi:MAG: hypothetical protein ISS56_02695 [Anaerolineae bacterium]|nr:hypothetical protein [Anaerolineae bacterium]
MRLKHRNIWIGLAGLVLGALCCLGLILGGMVALGIRPLPFAPGIGQTAPSTATSTSTPVVHPPLQTATPRVTPTETYPPTPQPTSTATPVPSSTPTVAPTPVVCSGLDGLLGMTLVPGQRFECTISEEQFLEQIRGQPDVPCSTVDATFDEDQIGLVCRLGIRITATGTAKAEDCRLVVEITRVTAGFTRVVQDLVNAQLATIPYDRVCIEQVKVDGGKIHASGYGR